VSLLYGRGSGREDFHAIVNAAPEGFIPLPAFEASSGPVTGAGKVVLLDEERLFSRERGWIDEPGKPLMFCVKRPASEVAVITVLRGVVEASIQDWLRKWAVNAFEPVRVTGGPDELRSGDSVLAVAGVPPPGQPDLILPLRCRFGAFELASWDAQRTVVHYNPATLAASGALAVIVALLGTVVFMEQKRAHAIAAQRASFVNRVSHELRTPLTNILLNIDLAVELSEEQPEEANHRLGLVRIEARRLGRLIENVLTFSRTEEGKMQIHAHACVPAEIVSRVIEQFLPSFQRRGLRIERHDENTSAACLCDPDALAQILSNLLSNVEKYVPGGVVQIATRVAHGELGIRVIDQGPGIPPEAAERIFQPFERIHSKINEGASGTGLGLAISRDLAIRLGGSLRLLPAPSESGCCFELRLPAPPATSPPP
jgi:signal transduction histidine kinase